MVVASAGLVQVWWFQSLNRLWKTHLLDKSANHFQTQFGWHILQVTDTRQQDMTKEVQERMARQILGERQFDTEVDSWTRELRANAYVEIKDANLDSKAPQK